MYTIENEFYYPFVTWEGIYFSIIHYEKKITILLFLLLPALR